MQTLLLSIRILPTLIELIVTNEQDMNIKRLGVAPYTILEIIGTYVNAQEMDTTSIDMYATQDLDLDGLGSLRLGLDVTQV